MPEPDNENGKSADAADDTGVKKGRGKRLNQSQGVGIGMCFGLIFGTAFDNLALGLIFGLLFGMVIGNSRKTEEEQDEKNPAD